MHCRRLAREFLHFLHIFGRSADAHQASEFTLLFDFLHFMHFLQILPFWTAHLFRPTCTQPVGMTGSEGGSGLADGRINDS